MPQKQYFVPPKRGPGRPKKNPVVYDVEPQNEMKSKLYASTFSHNMIDELIRNKLRELNPPKYGPHKRRGRPPKPKPEIPEPTPRERLQQYSSSSPTVEDLLQYEKDLKNYQASVLQNAWRNKKAIQELSNRYVTSKAQIISDALKRNVAKKKTLAAINERVYHLAPSKIQNAYRAHLARIKVDVKKGLKRILH